MKKLLLICMLALGAVLPMQAQRYLSEIFPSRTVIHDIYYGSNITIISGSPAADSMYYDVYRPMNDTMSMRPVVIVAPTGSFLPVPLNGQATGDKQDSAMVNLCHKLAARGFVAIAFNYRKGWQPTSANQETRTGSLLQAAYRGIQDARTLVRHLRDDVANNGNQHSINPNKIIVGGMGTGGYISLGVGYLDSYDEINLGKFLDSQGHSFVDTSLLGDVEGKWTRALNIGNYPSQSSDVNFVFNLGGAVGDSTWIEAGETPSVSIHSPNDPFAPYGFGPVIVPTTGDFVVDVSGSQGVQSRASRLGVNASYDQLIFIDAVSQSVANRNGGLNGLFPLFRPSPESAPWEEWDSLYWAQVPHPSGGSFTSVGMLTNPDMSHAKSITYLDSILSFVVPRIVCSMGLANCNLATNTDVATEQWTVGVYPNPSYSSINVSTDASNPLSSVVLTDLSGRQVKVIGGLKSTDIRIDHSDLTPGMYFLTAHTRKGVQTEKVLLY